jgi:D-alanyl-D-alanine carboxypeptidase
MLFVWSGAREISGCRTRGRIVSLRKTVLSLASLAAALLLASGIALAAVPGGSAAGEKGAGPTNTIAADAALDGALKSLVARHGGPPGAIAVVQRGKHREVHTYGVGNIETGRPMRADDHMRIASAAKAFSGGVALSLVGKGELSLNDTIGERLPELPDAWSEVTLRQLLNHTSGIPDFSLNPDFREAVFASLKKAPPPEELLTYVYDEDLLFTPGSKYHYSNSDNIAVALMVEAATGKSYERQLREQVYAPLGLEETSLPRGVYLERPYIHGYDNDPKDYPPEDYSKLIAAGWAWASGGIVSTPSDMNDFIRGYVGGDLFGRNVQTQQRRVFEGGSSEPPGPGYNSAGLALFRYQTRCGTVWGHTGNTPGYTQFMAASPNGNRSVVVSINTQLTPNDGTPSAFKALRRAEGKAVCAALAG